MTLSIKLARKVAGLAAIAMLGSAGAAGAQDAIKQFAVEGPGQLDCAEFLSSREDRSSPEYQRFIGFVEGYMSAANRYEPNTFDLTPWHNAAGFDLIMENHCRTHPDEAIVGVVQKMVVALKPVRVANFSPVLEVGTNEYRAQVYEAILKRTQAALKIKGYYGGAESGVYDDQLRNALLQFQQAENLTRTGVPDPATLWTLLNP